MTMKTERIDWPNASSSWLQLLRAFRGFRVHRYGLLLAISLAATDMAGAHDPGLSIATASRAGETLSIHLALARSDAERLVALDANHDGTVTEAEFQAAMPEMQNIGRQAFRLTVSGKSLVSAKPIVKLDKRDGLQFDITFQGVDTGALIIEAALLDKLPRGHRQFLSVRDPDHHLIGEQMLDACNAIFTAQLASNPMLSGRSHSFGKFLALGVEHIATGCDHLLFLLGLLLIGGTLRTALKIITSFTLAHSITLALATLNIINISPGIIEPLIAASIVFVGVQNIVCRGVEKRWLVTFAFGLIHGCGFASALRELGIGTNGTSVVVPLLSFNLGVEFGQLAITALSLPCIWKFQTSPEFVRRFVPVGSGLIVLAGGYWLIERTML